jgi:hypothetical protein
MSAAGPSLTINCMPYICEENNEVSVRIGRLRSRSGKHMSSTFGLGFCDFPQFVKEVVLITHTHTRTYIYIYIYIYIVISSLVLFTMEVYYTHSSIHNP